MENNIIIPAAGYPESGWGIVTGKAEVKPLNWKGTQWNIKC